MPGQSPETVVDALIELQVGPVAHGGWCVARHEGRVVFVRHALPGERVRARVTDATARLCRADAIEVLDASPDRVTPPCRYAGPGGCGGCDWQHASLPAQRRLKEAVITEQLRRIAGIEHAVTVEELPGPDFGSTGDRVPDERALPSAGLGWRTRVRYATTSSGRAGFHRHRSSGVQPVDECLIAHDEIRALGVEGQAWPGVERLEVAVSASAGDRLLRVEGPSRRLAVPRLERPVRVVRGRPAPGPALPYVREHAAGRVWRVSGGGFWQVHPAAADALVAAVLQVLRPVAGESAIDLYCGVGLFAGAVADQVGPAGRVLGIEADRIAARDARYNLRDLPGVRIERGRVERVLDAAGPADLVVLDPPRTGAGRHVVERVAELAGRRIAYVSCDPATLARDLATFAELGWTLAGLRAFDAFPMTHHVEIVADLVPPS